MDYDEKVREVMNEKRKVHKSFIESRCTLQEFLDLIDYNRSSSETLHFMDGNGEVTAKVRSNSPILIPNYDKLVESVSAGDGVFQIWLMDEEYEVIE